MTTEGPFKPDTSAPLGLSPLKRFRGKLVTFEQVTRTYEPREGDPPGTKARTSISVKHSFDDVTVIEASEPYPFPIAYITIPYSDPGRESNRGGTRWDAWAKSLRTVLGRAPDYDELTGKYMECYQGLAKTRQQDNETKVWGEVDTECWMVAKVEGVEAAGTAQDIMDYVATLGNGKTEQELYEVLLTDPKARGNQDVVKAITDRKLIETLTTTGKMTRSAEGVLSKVV